MQIEIMVIYHYIPNRRARIKNNYNIKYFSGCGDTRSLTHCCWESKCLQPFRKIVVQFFKKTKSYYATQQSHLWALISRKLKLKSIQKSVHEHS